MYIMYVYYSMEHKIMSVQHYMIDKHLVFYHSALLR